MTTEEIREYVQAAVEAGLEGVSWENGEVVTSPGGDGRFLGTVAATRYQGVPGGGEVFLAIGESEKGVQIVRLGRSECLRPGRADLDMMLEKELGIER